MGFSDHHTGAVLYSASSLLGTPHAFTARFGGVSDGIYASLNLGLATGDENARVRENYRILAKALGLSPEGFVFSKQVHGACIRAVSEKDLHQPLEPIPYEADGLITNVPGLPLVIFTADCIPVLLYDPAVGAVGAVHAGWRGTAQNIVGVAAREMTARYGSRPEDLRAAIGPGIGRCCFETGPDVPDAMRSALGALPEELVLPAGDRFRVDLKGINRFLLLRAGLSGNRIDVSEECTRCLHEKYWSHRYTHGARGSQCSLILVDPGRSSFSARSSV